MTSDWIPLFENIPKIGDRNLVVSIDCNGNKKVGIGVMINDTNCDWVLEPHSADRMVPRRGQSVETVIYWKPLPEIPT